MPYFIGITIGILIYSLILTAITLYKDSSTYFDVTTLDVILAGPITWILLLICICIQPIYKMFHKNTTPKKKKPYKPKSQKYIQKIIKKTVKNYAKQKYHSDYFDFTRTYADEYRNFEGYDRLLVKKASNEHVNKRFKALIWHQPEETIAKLKNYFEPVTEQRMRQDGYHDWYIQEYKGELPTT